MRTIQPLVTYAAVCHAEMLENAGIDEVFDFASSALDCECPVVVADSEYEAGDHLDDCEYGTVELDVIAVSETKDDALAAISSVIFALHQTDRESWSSDRISIRGITVDGLPEYDGQDASGCHKCKVYCRVDACVCWR